MCKIWLSFAFLSLLLLDRDKRFPHRSQIQFDASENNNPTEDAIDQLSAEMDRVLQRRYDFDAPLPSLEEIKQSNQEMGRILGNMRKARILLKKN